MNGFSKTWTYLLSAKSAIVYSSYLSLKNKPCFAEWDSNWDKKNTIASTGANNYFLIRHGEYNEKKARNESEKLLTARGIQQAKALGVYLNTFLERNPDLKLVSVVSSNVLRAIQTSQFAFTSFENKIDNSIRIPEDGYKIQAYNGLDECSPHIANADLNKSLSDNKRTSIVISRRLLNQAASEIFERPNNANNDERLTLVFCHANVIRYLLLHLLQLPCAAWKHFSLYHCSITWIRIDNNGFVTCKSFGDAGHFTTALRTSCNA